MAALTGLLHRVAFWTTWHPGCLRSSVVFPTQGSWTKATVRCAVINVTAITCQTGQALLERVRGMTYQKIS
ncbi:hypothetical protein EVAR_33610_1 [Eumeta japonica]|uniref:Uncharacterized protein n=1 Tax=Eumeta variegata TaxID=151549 RepID=A0A4C1WA15_EUMVA|nr:hypothetical protein EVAR_33610_1 [Eumeta japonica]